MQKTEEYTGKIYVNKVNNATIHSYVGYSGDVSNIIETENSLILIDAQPTHSASEELLRYMDTLDKPVKHVLVPSHSLGLDYYEGTSVASSEQISSFNENGGAQVFVDIFKGAFGDDMDERIVPINSTIKDGENTVEGVNFIMTTHEEEFPPTSDLEFTDYNVLFTHLAAHNSHMLVGSPEKIDELEDYWTEVKTKDYDLIISSHLMPVDTKAADFQLQYLVTLREASKNENKEKFIADMQAAYPDAQNQHFLSMTANNFYGQ